MQMEAFLSAVRESLGACSHPRLFKTERGFQGQLQVELFNRVHLPNEAIIEPEYQKVIRFHGLRTRPDIIIHEPFDPKIHTSRREGNYAVFALKLAATKKDAEDDFKNLTAMIEILRYPIGIFVNVGSDDTFADLIPRKISGVIVSYGVSLINGTVHVIQQR